MTAMSSDYERALEKRNEELEEKLSRLLDGREKVVKDLFKLRKNVNLIADQYDKLRVLREQGHLKDKFKAYNYNPLEVWAEGKRINEIIGWLREFRKYE